MLSIPAARVGLANFPGIDAALDGQLVRGCEHSSCAG
jgi:hypothetical protein